MGDDASTRRRAARLCVLVVSAVLATATAAHATPTAVSVAGGPLAVAGPVVHNVAVVNLEGAAQVVERPWTPSG